MMICGLTLIGGIIGAGRATFERNVCEREVALGLDGEITTITGRVRSVTEKENGWELILDACELENSELDYAGKLDHENYENHVKKRRLLRRILVKINQETEPGFGSGQKTDSEIESE